MQMTTARPRGIRPIAGNEGRYTAVQGDGRRLWFRNQVTLKEDVVSMLKERGPLPKKRLIMDLNSAQAAMELALGTLEADCRVERFRALSSRNRMDEFWCLFGHAPRPESSFRFKGEQILDGFRAAAQRMWSAKQ
jgi:hypothetical protein